MNTFCNNQNINYINVHVRRNQDQKKIINYPSGWQTFDTERCDTYNSSGSFSNMHALLFSSNNNIVCFDTDSVEAYNELCYILKKLHLLKHRPLLIFE